MEISYKEKKELPFEQVVALYEAIGWSCADKPKELYQALINSHSLVSAWSGDLLIGIGNAISDGYLVVYYPHLVVHPDYRRFGVGSRIMEIIGKRYDGFHQQMLVADSKYIEFYKECGFERAGQTEPMWKYQGNEH